MREFLRQTVAYIIDEPDKIVINEEFQGDKVIYTLQVAKDDIGKVIGKKGRNAQALRVLMTAACMKEGKRAMLEIVDK